MKNLSTNESTYFESALGTPTKLPQNFEAQKPKQIFLIDSGLESQPGEMEYPLPLPPLPDLQPKKKIEPKIEKNKNILKKVKNKTAKNTHLLNFDGLFKDIILQQKKKIIKKLSDKKPIKKNNKPGKKQKLIGVKKIRENKNKIILDKSKYFFYYYL